MKLNAFQLKWIAIITMLIDHTGVVLFPSMRIWRMAGRIAFPVFCFLLVEGFFHTRDIYRYMTRLGLFALISEIPYDLAFRGTVLEFGSQNVFFTLCLGVVLMYVMQDGRNMAVRIAELFLVFWAAGFLRCDYGQKGILLILVYYLFREQRELQLLAGAFWNFLYGIGKIQNYGIFATAPLALYNGEKGPGLKYFFYLFYPAHLFLLYIIKNYYLEYTGL